MATSTVDREAQRAKARDIAAITNKALGTDSVHVANNPRYVVEFLPTGILVVDCMLKGGLPRGRFTTIVGDFSTLKSWVGYMAIATTQANGGVCALVDMEHSFDPEWAADCGVDVDALLIQRPSNGELAIDTVQAWLTHGSVDLIVFDSVAAALPQDESKKRLHDENIQPARLAALMSAAMRRLTAVNDRTAVLWINQVREGVGVMFGPKEKATGGKALPFYSSYILNMKKVGKITVDAMIFTGLKRQTVKEQVGQTFRMELQKSKLSKPFREMWFDWSLTGGYIDDVGFTINQCVDNGVIKVNSAKWQYGDLEINGREKFKEAVAANPDLAFNLRQEVLAHHGLPHQEKVDIVFEKPAKPKPKKRATAAKKAPIRKARAKR